MIGIRREDKNEWERRVPLVPEQVRQLIDDQRLEIRVQPSTVRAFADAEYRDAGADVDEQLSSCAVVLGIKEIPRTLLGTDQAYLFFSHTLKGQAHNMPLLETILERGNTLLDYELIADEAGRRLIFFGRHAGYAGMIDALWALGKRLRVDGHPTPFADVRPAHGYPSLKAALAHLGQIGDRIREHGLPEGLGPLVFGFTGTGNVSLGAQEILAALPVRQLALTTPEALERELATADARHQLFQVVLDIGQRFRHRDGGAVQLNELIEHPERFENGIEPWLGSVSVLVNGMFWVPTLPRLLTLDYLQREWNAGLGRLRIIADIACDIDGAIEATVRATTPAKPAYVWDAAGRRAIDGFSGDGPVILAVDNLPAELPRESSTDFGKTLLPFVPALGRCDWTRPLERLDLPPELARAVIAHRGQLAPDHAWLSEHLGKDSGNPS